VFVQQGSLWARRLDLGRLQWNGEPDLITDSIGGRSSRRGGFSVSPDGRIAYRKQASISQLTWLDREGKASGRPLDPDSNSLVAPEISPDGKRVAVDRTAQGNRDVWLIDLVVLDGKMMASSIHASGSSFEAETPRVLFQVQIESGSPGGGHPAYAVSRDGRLLVNQFTEATSDNPITLILNWKPKSH
jgi:hypothetical protein